MEITGKVLREVEFRDRLRGYDTDEVDEFLEEVAVAVDELHQQLAQRATRVAPAEVVRESQPGAEQGFDDDAIRRTLILAQRTADLAIKEANEEAASILESARREAHDLVAQANESARRLRQEADEDFSARVNLQLAQREQLENDVRVLGTLVSEERGRLAESLQTVLHYVVDNLFVSEEVTKHASTSPPVPPAETGDRAPEDAFFGAEDGGPEEETEADDVLDDVIEDPLVFTEQVPILPLVQMPSGTDPDEELWQRWSQSESFDDEDGQSDTDPFGFNRRP
ncbi:MAG TPA: DivIVA domain-containing protein [Acidimicrobiales bacterium]|nr:DivIVA domain-containing protein [Acidimicrobiales bacterium]